MPNDNRSIMARALAKLAGPKTIAKKMGSRQERLGTGETGGMFDIIYKKKLEREQAMQNAYNEGEDPAANTAAMRGAGPDEPIEWEAYSSMPPPQAPSFFQRLIGSDIPGSAAVQSQAPEWLVRLLMQKRRAAPPAQGQDQQPF